MKHRSEYAVYRGDQFIDLGTIDYLSEKLGISKKVLWWYAGSKRYRAKEHNRGLIVIKIEEEE